MGLVLTLALSGIHAQRRALGLSLFLFGANSIGYFLGSMINDFIRGRPGMLLWGVIYGLCLGAGLGAVLHFAQLRRSS
jgi:F0F1-type ATP synthase assembly protein I